MPSQIRTEYQLLARSRRRSPHQGSTLDLLRIDQILAKVQIGLLIAVIFTVPLVVLPESNFIDITSTPKSTILRMIGTLQGGILLSRFVLGFISTDQNRLGKALTEIRSNRPVLFILGSVTAVTVVSLISAMLSILPHQSWWGRVPAGFESGEFTALMYVILSVSTFISIREFSVGDWLWKTLTLTALSAGLVGFFQYLGWSPLDISATHSIRLSGTNGNPIFFGAMLILLAPVALGYLISRHQMATKPNNNLWLLAIAITSFVLSVSLVGAASRGPWLGALIGGIVAVSIIAIYGRTHLNLKPMLVTIAAIIVGALLVTFVDPTPIESTTDDSSSVSSTLGGVGRTSTLDLRIRYWKLSADISADRNPVPYTNDAPKFVRLLFGYGPDMFRFAGTYFADSTTFTRRLTAAHNDPINRLVEQGIFGFIAWIALWLSIACGCLILIRRSGLMYSNPSAWITTAIAVAFTSRFTEQLFGSPTPGGVLVFWILVGALPAMLLLPGAQSNRATTSKKNPAAVQYGGIIVVAMIAIGSIALAWDKGANYLIADQMSSFQYRSTVLSADEAIDRLEQTVKLAPDVPRYWQDLAEIEHGRAAVTENLQVKAEALSRAYEYDLKGYEANPLEVNSIYKLAFSAWEAGNAGRPELRQEAVRLYGVLTEIIPSDNLAKERLQILNDFLAQ